MTDLIFATNNQHKADEILLALPQGCKVRTLRQAGIDIDVPEPHPTLEENAREKAWTINRLTAQVCFSEDTGLEVAALEGRPGVRSARFAGENSTSDQNIELLLSELIGVTDRAAQFRTVICLIKDGEETLFEGTCPGSITTGVRGKGGFGYDPVFIPTGSHQTFAEMGMAEKNRFSHRRKAVDKLVAFLEQSNINK